MSRFDYVKYDDQACKEQAEFKTVCVNMDTMISSLQSPRAKALAITALEECYMWIGKAIRDDQIYRSGAVPQEERTDS